ncbi:MAG: D-alanyl-D-alanine carboxypeptidase/D-alanyl-D-alanine-endopeptidase [Verrucomicrobiota bacterium]
MGAPFQAAEPRTKFEGVMAAVDALARGQGMESASLGVVVLPIAGGAPVVDFNGRKSFVPASTMKLLTTGVALDHLGPDFRFETFLERAGDDLVVRGTGDPTLAEYRWDPLFAKWKTAMVSRGVTEVRGKVIGDDAHFASQRIPDPWVWNDIGNYYAAGTSGLNFFSNQYFVYFKPGASTGSPAAFLRASPEPPGVEFVNEMRSGAVGSGDQGYIYCPPLGSRAVFRGTVPRGNAEFRIRGSTPDPALLCATLFTEYLRENGVRVTGDPATPRSMASMPSLDRREIIHTSRSEPLSELIRETNFESRNVYAESILKSLAKEEAGAGSTVAGTKVVMDWIRSRGITTTGLAMHDGSGLARANLITPRQIVYILRALATTAHGDVFLASLPVAGRSGTLEFIGGGTVAEGRIRAKSGTLDRLKCYAGFCDALSGERFAFAIFVNHYDGSYSPVKAGITRVMSSLASVP